MAARGVLVLVLALTWTATSAVHRLAFPEDVRGGQRIVSGWEAVSGQFPYQLSLRMVTPVGGVVACGATLIHNEWALTAAHCTANRVTIVIRAGAVSLTRPEVIFETTEYYNHPLYIEQLSVVQPHDIGVIKFNRFVEYSDRIKPIRLQSSYDRSKDYNGIRLHASGWGNTWTGGSSPENLNWVYLLGTSNFNCWMAFGGSSIIVDSTICASHYNVTSQSTCQGDSGGPLVTIDVDGVESQVGISSFVSATGCHTGFPAGFIRPGYYHDWFTEVTGLSFDWNPLDLTTAAPETTTEAEATEPTKAPESESNEDSGSDSSEASESSEGSKSSESSEASKSSESSEQDEDDETRKRI